MRCVIEWKEVSSRLMWLRVKIERENLVFISAYGYMLLWFISPINHKRAAASPINHTRAAASPINHKKAAA